jgi:hypothetical protein
VSRWQGQVLRTKKPSNKTLMVVSRLLQYPQKLAAKNDSALCVGLDYVRFCQLNFPKILTRVNQLHFPSIAMRIRDGQMDNLDIGKVLCNRVKRFCVSVNHRFGGRHGRSGILVSG